jgi:eukaryotic-like serine/threonine-protein kinase
MLQHENIIHVYDFHRERGALFIVMEYVQGIDLYDLLEKCGRLPYDVAAIVAMQVARALDYVHYRSIVHRDIKPANVILSERGGEPDVAKVVDFGLVKPLVADSTAMTMSAANVLTGTPLYMPPEAMNAPDVADPRSDLYALGAVGYFLLTGHAPFEGATVFEVIGHHLHTTPAPPSTRTANSVPPDLEAVILQCLRKNPADRPRDARALRQALERCTLAPRWTADDAATWWRTFRNTQPPDAAPAVEDHVSGMTITVDVDDRVASR